MELIARWRPLTPWRRMPPYLPTVGTVTTAGFSGSRWSTGGSVPAATRAARIGDSWYIPDDIVVPVDVEPLLSVPALANARTGMTAAITSTATNLLIMGNLLWLSFSVSIETKPITTIPPLHST